MLQKESQEINWDLLQEEDGQDTKTIEMELENDIEKDKDKSVLSPAVEEKEVDITEKDQIKDMVVGDQVKDNNTAMEGQNGWELRGVDIPAGKESIPEVNKDGWPAWQEVRQGKRIKDAGLSHLKLDGKDQNMDKDPANEGNLALQQNSFAVFSNPHIISLANMMGIDSDSMSFEKLIYLKTLKMLE